MFWKIPHQISKSIDGAILVGAVLLALIGGFYFLAEEHYARSEADAKARSGGWEENSTLSLQGEVLARLRDTPELAGAVPTAAAVTSPAGATLIVLARGGNSVGLTVAYSGRAENAVVSFKDQHHGPLASRPIRDGAIALLADDTRQVRVYLDGTFVEEIDLSGIIPAHR